MYESTHTVKSTRQVQADIPSATGTPTYIGGTEYLWTSKNTTNNIELSETALNTTADSGGNGFPYKYRTCGKRGHKAKDCGTPMNERLKFQSSVIGVARRS